MALRIATFNLENLDNEPSSSPSLADRIRIMRPQLDRVNADIICFQEVHSQDNAGNRTLAALDSLIAGTNYSGFYRATSLTQGNLLYASRNIVTLSRFPIISVEIIRDNSGPRPSYQLATAIPADTTADPIRWERPMLYTEINLGSGRILHLINVHFKSKIASNIPGQKINDYTWRSVSAWAEGSFIASMKRVGQAVQGRLKVDEIFDNHGDDAFIAFCGDFNAESDDIPVRAICGHVEDTGNPDHGPRLLIPCENNIPDSSRYSLLHLGKGKMLDHILVSRHLLRFFGHAEIHNEGLPDESGAFRNDIKFPESDHAPVIAEFEIS